MCRLASFFHNPATGDVVVGVLDHHQATVEKLKLDQKIWREGHYLPDGTIEARVQDNDRVTQDECNERIRNRWPSFGKFLSWALREIEQNEVYPGPLDLSGLTSAKDLVLPKTISGGLYLSGLTSAKDLVLPKTISGGLDLRGLTSAKDLVLPKTISGWLDLRGLTSAKDLVLPKTISGGLDLSGLSYDEKKKLGL
ncbi:MAG: hypothetical protein ABFD89_06320 [Bryobacteraceae bacterium]